MVHEGISDDFDSMQSIYDALVLFFDGQFIQTNPLPIKTALEWSGFIKAYFRLPLCPMDSGEKEQWHGIYMHTLEKI